MYPLPVHFAAEPRIRRLPVIIRKYCKADMDEIIGIWFQGWHAIASSLVHPQSKAEWRERWISRIVPQHEIAVAESDNEILGFITLNPESFELSQIFTRLSQQGHGVGSALINWAKNRSHAGIFLFTLEINYRSREFYEKHGFRETGSSTNPISGLPTVRYEWEATDSRLPSETTAIVYQRKMIRLWHSDR